MRTLVWMDDRTWASHVIAVAEAGVQTAHEAGARLRAEMADVEMRISQARIEMCALVNEQDDIARRMGEVAAALELAQRHRAETRRRLGGTLKRRRASSSGSSASARAPAAKCPRAASDSSYGSELEAAGVALEDVLVRLRAHVARRPLEAALAEVAAHTSAPGHRPITAAYLARLLDVEDERRPQAYRLRAIWQALDTLGAPTPDL